MMMSKSRSRPEPITVTGPTSFLPVLDVGSASPSRLSFLRSPAPAPPASAPPPQRKLKSKPKRHQPVSTFLTLDRLEDIEEEREDGSAPPVPFRPKSPNTANAQHKRIARLWDFNRFSSNSSASSQKSIAFDTQSILTPTSEDSQFYFPLPPNTIPRGEDQLSPLDPDVTFSALLSPLTPVSPASSGSCYSPIFSAGTSERFTPMTPVFSPVKNRASTLTVSVAPDDRSLSHSAPQTPTSPSHLSVQSQRACPSPDLDPELSAHSSGSSQISDEGDGLVSPAEFPEELDEFRIIPRLFGSWSFDGAMDSESEFSLLDDGHEDARWDRAIDEVFAMVRSRRPSAQSEFGCIPDASVPEFDKELVRRLSEVSAWLVPSRAAPSPPASPRSATPEQGDSMEKTEAVTEESKQVGVAPLVVKKAEKPRPAPLAAVPFYPPPAMLTANGSINFDRPPPTQELPSAAFSPASTYSILSPTSVSPFMPPVDPNTWPTWSAYEPRVDRRPSASALSLMSKFSDDSLDSKFRQRHGASGSRRSKMSTSTISSTKPPSPPSAWFKRGARSTAGISSSFTSLNALAIQASGENKSKKSPRSSLESIAPPSPPANSRSSSPSHNIKGVLRRSQMPAESFLRA